MNITPSILFFFISFIGYSIPAQSELRLDEVLKSVDAYHPKLRQILMEVRAANAHQLSQKGIYDPQLSAKAGFIPYGDYENGKANVEIEQMTNLWGLKLLGGWRLGQGDYPGYKLGDKTGDGGQGYLGLKLPLLKGGSIDKGRAELKVAQYNTLATRTKIAITKIELKRSASIAYWKWIAAGHRLKVLKDLYHLADKRRTQLQAKIESGNAAKITLIENQRALLKRQGSIRKALRYFEKASLKLSFYLRNDEGVMRLPLKEELPVLNKAISSTTRYSMKDDIAFAISRCPQLKVLVQENKKRTVMQKLAGNEKLPQLNLSTIGSYDLADEAYLKRHGEFFLGLEFKLPLFVRKARGKEAYYRAKGRQISAKHRYIVDQIKIRIQDAHSAINAARDTLKLALQEAKVAHQIEKAERKRLDLGSSSLLFVNIREQQAAEAELRVIQSIRELQTALVNYQAVTLRNQ